MFSPYIYMYKNNEYKLFFIIYFIKTFLFKLELEKTSLNPNLIIILNNLSNIKPFSNCVLQLSKISTIFKFLKV